MAGWLQEASVRRSGRIAIRCASLFLCCTTAVARAQQPPTAPGVLPDAPIRFAGSISGTVTDKTGVAVAGAEVTLANNALSEDRKDISDAAGHFHFANIPPGIYQLTITSDGLATGLTSGILKPGENSEIPNIRLSMASASADVDVTMSRVEVAEEEIKEEETQRLGGFLPNFYVVYNWHAAPLTAKQKLKLGAHTIVDPANFAVGLVTAAVEQGLSTHNGYMGGWTGYGKRLGATEADFVSGTMIGGALLPALLHQDPRYFYMGSGHSVTKRLLYALSTAVICRGDSGKWQVNYSGIGGDIATGAISNLYYPSSERNGVSLTIENGLLAAASDGVGNVVQEFVFRHFTPHPPTYTSTKP